jgi:hypothetical protein
LVTHFQEAHKNLLGRFVTLPSELLKPAWFPSAPASLPSLPLLPTEPIDFSAIQTPTVVGFRRNCKRPPSSQPPSGLQRSPKKAKMLHCPTLQNSDEDENCETNLDFENLDQSRDWAKNDEVREWVVRERPPPTKEGSLSRPQIVFGAWKREKPVPKTIHYDTFVLMVDESSKH